MTNLWRGVAGAAILSAALAACTSPHYPIRDDQTPGPAPLSAPEPKYPISQGAPPPAAAPAQTDAAAAEPASPQIAAPVGHVDSEALPPAAGAPAASSVGAPAAAEAPAGGDTPPPVATQPASPPPSPPPPAAATTDAAPPVSPPPPPPSALAAPASEPVITPRMVVHDQSGAPPPVVASKPIREASAAPPPPVSRHAAEHEIIAGDVVDAGDSIFENYQVQKGDHIDALARSFATSRKVLLDENKVRPPYLLRPGEILKVPVAKAYVAESGDTLSGVAKRFSVEVGELAQLNHLSDRAALHDGQKIGLPSSMRDKGPIHLGGLNEYAYGEGSRPPQASSRVSSTLAPPAHPGLTPLNGSGQISQERSGGYSASPPQQPPPAQAGPALSDSDISAAAHGRFVWPVRGDIVARFGPMGVGRRNDGVDIKAAQGSPVKSAAPGEVVYAGDQVPGYGNLVLIKHADGWVTAYAHLDTLSVAMKDRVQQGQVVGEVGMTGGVTEPELHFEVRYAPTPEDKPRPVDPVLVLPAG